MRRATFDRLICARRRMGWRSPSGSAARGKLPLLSSRRRSRSLGGWRADVCSASIALCRAEGGERTPFLTGVRANNAFYSLNEQAGRPAVLLHVGLLGLSAAAPFALAFHRRAGEFEARAADVLCLVDATNSHLSVYAAAPLATPHVVSCPPEVLRPWRFDPREPAVVVIDRNTRVIALIVSADPDDTAEAALVALASCPVEPPRDETTPASGDALRNAPPDRSPFQGASKRWFGPPEGVQFCARRPEHAAGLFCIVQ